MLRESDTSVLLVSTLGIHLKPQSKKGIVSITLKAGQDKRNIYQVTSPGSPHHKSFDPPLRVSFNDKISVVVQFQGVRTKKTISLTPQDVLHGAIEEDGRKVYRKPEENIELVIGIQSHPSAFCKTLASCSRFRVLMIGESGVGKSTLITKVFGFSGADVSDITRGKASVDQEFISPVDPRFVVHDSCGFEAADCENLVTVRNFISCRRSKPGLEDQIHMVWLCLSIPYADGRLMEAGVEHFLKDKKEILGDVPLVMVFTKLDLLVNMMEVDALTSGENCCKTVLKERAQESFHKLCLTPVKELAGSDLPHVAVSAKEGYEDSLSALSSVTEKNIQKYAKDEGPPARVDISPNVPSTIGGHMINILESAHGESEFPT